MSLVLTVYLVFLAQLWSTDKKAEASGSVYEIEPGASFRAAVAALKAGDTLVVHQGKYSDAGTIRITVKGTTASPIVIRGAPGEKAPLITRPQSAEIDNTIYIDGASHLLIKGLEISGNGSDGVRLVGAPSYITLEDLVIHDVAVGINLRSSMHHITIRKNHIFRTGILGTSGEGLYVGCHSGSCAVSYSTIEGNWIHDTFMGSDGDGIEIKLGSHSNMIRDNTIYNTKYPGILLYGTDGKGRNVVEGNVLWNCEDSGIQATADAVIRNNIIFGGPGSGFSSRKREGISPGNVEFVHNTVVGGDPCLQLIDWNRGLGLVFANNAVYCDDPKMVVSGLSRAAFRGNVVYPARPDLPNDGYVVGQAPALDFQDVMNRNVYPTSVSRLIAAGDPFYATERDFNGTKREGLPDAGAYAWTDEQNPGWKIGPGFKQTVSKPREPEPTR